MLPSTTALGIPELLEMVLDHATPQDLLLWQRVNNAWRAAIQKSPRIQERLFFRIREIYETVSHEEVVVANPFLEFFAEKCGEATYFFSDDAFDGKASHPTASWRQMFTSSPAVTKLDASIGFKGRGVGFRIKCETGMTIGRFADALKEYSAPYTRAGEVPKCFLCTI